MTTEETLRDRAAEPVLLRIQADIDGAGARLRPLLRTIRASLFERTFNVDALWRENGIRDRNAAGLFRELETTPSAYIFHARMETAERLLLCTNLPIYRVAELVGYASHITFRRAFKRWKECKPTTVRERVGFACLDEPGFDKEVASALTGRLGPAQIAGLVNRLRVAALELEALERGLPHDLGPLLRDAARLEPYLVSLLVLPRLTGASFGEQRQVILRSRPFSTSALFQALHQRSREEGRKERQRGVELSQLAVDSVEVNAASLGPLYHVLRPQAWAWLGNAHRIHLDFLAADRAIETAQEALRSTEDPFATGIVHVCQGTLRTYQRRHEEAVELFDVALPAFEEAEDESWQIRTLIQRATSLLYAERFDDSLMTLYRAAAFPGASHESFAFFLPHTIVTVLVRANRWAEAKERLRVLDTARGFGASKWRMRWLEAYIAHVDGELGEAEDKYLSSVRELETLDEPLDHALVLLDLAVLYADQKRPESVLRICETIYPFFESLRLHEETTLSVRLLGQAISEDRVSRDALRGLRSKLNRDPLARA